jgi:phosphohistidine phosphatase
VCSPAIRTRQTWQLMAAELDGAPDPVFDERIYAGTCDALLTVVHAIPDDVGSALLVGHNPGVADLVADLTGQEVEMKTSAVAVVGLAGSWAGAATGRATLVAHVTPRG